MVPNYKEDTNQIEEIDLEADDDPEYNPPPYYKLKTKSTDGNKKKSPSHPIEHLEKKSPLHPSQQLDLDTDIGHPSDCINVSPVRCISNVQKNATQIQQNKSI